MNKILLWVLAFLITASVAVYQRLTGPTYPIKGEAELLGYEVKYKFNRSQDVGINHDVKIETQDSEISAVLKWKRFKTNDDWTKVQMIYSDGAFSAELPSQPPAGKLEYYVELEKKGESITLPKGKHVVIRFKGAVPAPILIIHVIAMFGAMFLSTRTGLDFFSNNPDVKVLTYLTISFLFVGGMILGPIIQKYAFDAYWTGFPFGHDLTDNKTAAALIFWLIALYMYRKTNKPHKWALTAAIVLLIVYLIPHSLLGSELDYSELDENIIQQQTEQLNE